jgi:hypothetical protein
MLTIALVTVIFSPFFYGINGAGIATGAPDLGIYVDVHVPERVWAGTTLLGDMHDPRRPRIIEVNMLGEVVWEYVIPEIARPRAQGVCVDAELLPNNNILFLSFYKGVFEVDRKGNIVWSYLDEKVSHDADRLLNGNTLMVWGWDEVGARARRNFDPSTRPRDPA